MIQPQLLFYACTRSFLQRAGLTMVGRRTYILSYSYIHINLYTQALLYLTDRLCLLSSV